MFCSRLVCLRRAPVIFRDILSSGVFLAVLFAARWRFGRLNGDGKEVGKMPLRETSTEQRVPETSTHMAMETFLLGSRGFPFLKQTMIVVLHLEWITSTPIDRRRCPRVFDIVS